MSLASVSHMCILTDTCMDRKGGYRNKDLLNPGHSHVSLFNNP